MKKLGVMSGLVFLFLTLSCASFPLNNGCALPPESLENQNARNAVVRINVTERLKMCIGDHCQKMLTNKWGGTGTVISNNGNYTKILTAAHVCLSVMEEQQPPDLDREIVVIFQNEKEEQATVVKVDVRRHIDLCLLQTKRVVSTYIKLSPTPPRIRANYHYFGFPGLVYAHVENQKPMIPHYWGEFFGYDEFRSGMVATYGIYAKKGASGSAILNYDGYLVGVLHSLNIRNDKMLYASPYDALKDFLKDVR